MFIDPEGLRYRVYDPVAKQFYIVHDPYVAMQHANNDTERLAISIEYQYLDGARTYGLTDAQIYAANRDPYFEGTLGVPIHILDPRGFELLYPLESQQQSFIRGLEDSGVWQGSRLASVACAGTVSKPTSSNVATSNKGTGTGNTTSGTGNVQNISKEAANWLEPNSKVITNSSGDKVFVSQDGLRKIRFDMNNPKPHSSPHMHIEELINGKWKPVDPNNAQIYPIDVPHK